MEWYEEDDEQIGDMPVSPRVKVIRKGMGQEAGNERDAIEWAEIQRLLFEQDWGPILALPPTNNDFFMKGQWEDGVDVSAFNTHDYQRTHRKFDGTRYAIQETIQKHRQATWMLEMIMDRIKSPAKYTALRYVEKGVIEPEMCEGEMWRAAVWHRRCLKLEGEVQRLKERQWGCDGR